jgi:hypothetical protein
MYKKALLACAFLLVTGSVFAEGGSCPPGYYPIGGQGTAGCAPIPEYGSSEGAISEREAIQPVWETRWGAISVDISNGKFGTGKSMLTKKQAEEAASDDCKKEGGKNCVVDLAYYNQCAAVAWGAAFVTTASAESKEQASSRAAETCGERTSACKVYYSDCSFPVRVQ